MFKKHKRQDSDVVPDNELTHDEHNKNKNKNKHKNKSTMFGNWHEGLSHEQKSQVNEDMKHGQCWDCFICRCFSVFGFCSGFKCCCCSYDARKPIASIEHDRHFTDVPCCCLLIIALACQAYFFSLSLQNGADPKNLLYLADWEGNLCTPDSSAGRFAAWPDIRLYNIIICVNDCNQTLYDSRMVTPPFDTDLGVAELTNEQIYGYRSVQVFNAFCLPSPESASSILSDTINEGYKLFEDQIDAFSENLQLGFNDILQTSYLFIICGFTALIVSVLWGCMIRYCGGCIVWSSITLTIAGVALIGYLSVYYSRFARAFGYDTVANIMYYGGIIVFILDCFFAIAICAVWSRIRLAIAITKEATMALQHLWSLFFYPIVPFLLFSAYITYFVYVTLHIGSVITFKREPFPEGYRDSEYYNGGRTLYEALGGPTHYRFKKLRKKFQYALIMDIFVFIWVLYFIGYHTYMVISGVYADWYFSDWAEPKKKSKEPTHKKRGSGETELSHFAVMMSFKRTTKYHCGTLALASLLIAIVAFIEKVLTYVEKKFVTQEPSPLRKCVLGCIKCALKCLKCLLNRINKNGLIITAIYGWPFCAASIKGLSIVMRNIVRASALTMVSGYLERMGKVAIVSFNTGLMLVLLYFFYGDTISSLLFPTLLCAVISAMICWQYMNLYEVGLSAIFMCFLIDEERNKGGYMKASNRLKRIIGESKGTKKDVAVMTQTFRSDMIDKKQREHFSPKNHEHKYTKFDMHVLSDGGRLQLEHSYSIESKEEYSDNENNHNKQTEMFKSSKSKDDIL